MTAPSRYLHRGMGSTASPHDATPSLSTGQYLHTFLAVLWAGGGAIAVLVLLGAVYFAVTTRARPLTVPLLPPLPGGIHQHCEAAE
mmetsp:Transcript_87162/g.174108  ORF Transcript_87162/g.174108 Transcript_87162/m.174108 type:complete len:86 (+) Transcript_87162:95-352(+)